MIPAAITVTVVLPTVNADGTTIVIHITELYGNVQASPEGQSTMATGSGSVENLGGTA